MLFLVKLIGKMDKNILKILSEKKKILKIKDKEFLKKIFLSIKQNNNVKNFYKNYITHILMKNLKKNYRIVKKNKICFMTGKYGSVYKYLNLSRYMVKTLIIENKLTNAKKNN